MKPKKITTRLTPKTTIESIYKHELNRAIGGGQKRYLSTRTYHALKMFISASDRGPFKKLCLLHLSQFITEKDLSTSRNMGTKSLNEVKALLAMVGLSLKKDPEKVEYKPTGITHDIRTISQLAKVATKENFGVLMADLAECVLLQVHNPQITLINFVWTDDGVQGLKKITLIPKKTKGGK